MDLGPRQATMEIVAKDWRIFPRKSSAPRNPLLDNTISPRSLPLSLRLIYRQATACAWSKNCVCKAHSAARTSRTTSPPPRLRPECGPRRSDATAHCRRSRNAHTRSAAKARHGQRIVFRKCYIATGRYQRRSKYIPRRTVAWNGGTPPLDTLGSSSKTLRAATPQTLGHSFTFSNT